MLDQHFRLFYDRMYILLIFASTLFCRSASIATKYSSYNGEPSLTFLDNIFLFLSLFFLMPVVVEMVYSLAALLDTDISEYRSSFSSLRIIVVNAWIERSLCTFDRRVDFYMKSDFYFRRRFFWRENSKRMPSKNY